MDDVRIVQADLGDPAHGAAVLAMTRAYARDPMGDGRDLSDEVQRVLVDRLRAHPTALVFLAFAGGEPAGIATCFVGLSTFSARPVVNVHDLHVAPDRQRRGIGRALLEAVERRARELGAVRLTLEVQEGNAAALALYHRFGFEEGRYDARAGRVLFRVKPL